MPGTVTFRRARRKKEPLGIVQIDLGIDLRAARQLDVALGGGEFDRAHVAGRPGGAEQLLGGRVRLRQLDVQLAVVAAGDAVAAILLWVLPVKRVLAIGVMAFMALFLGVDVAQLYFCAPPIRSPGNPK